MHAPRLLSCGGRCDNPERRGCNDLCSTAQGTGSQVTLAYSSRSDTANGGQITANYTCGTPPGDHSGRRLQDYPLEARILPTVCGTSYVVVSVQDATSPYAGLQTLQLSIDLGSLQENLYIVFGSEEAPMTLPPAFQAGAAFGVDIGGVDPTYFSVSLEAELDSWLTIGATDGSLGDQLSAVNYTTREK